MIAYAGGGLIGAGTVSGFMVALPAIVILAAIALGFTLLAIAVERAGNRVQPARERILANERAGELEPAPLGHRRIGLDRSRRMR